MGHVAAIDIARLKRLEGDKQKSQLQLTATLFDKTGKALFLYFIFPPATKQLNLTGTDETVNTVADGIWRFMPDLRKRVWLVKTRLLKKELGDGKVKALDRLRLDDGTLLQRLAEEALQRYLDTRRPVVDTDRRDSTPQQCEENNHEEPQVAVDGSTFKEFYATL